MYLFCMHTELWTYHEAYLIPGSLSGLSDLIDYSLPGTPSPPPEPANQGAAPVSLPAEPKKSSSNHQHNKTSLPEDKVADKRPSRPRKRKNKKSNVG